MTTKQSDYINSLAGKVYADYDLNKKLSADKRLSRNVTAARFGQLDKAKASETITALLALLELEEN